MNLKKPGIFAFLTIVSLAVSAAELPFSGGVCCAEKDGRIIIRTKNGDQMKLNFTTVLPNWRFCRQSPLKQVQVLKETGNAYSIRGLVPAGKALLPYQADLFVEKGELTVKFRITLPEKLALQKNANSPFLSYDSEPGKLNNTLMKLGDRVFRLPVNNTWGFGKVILLSKYQLKLVRASDGTSLSCWGGAKSAVSIRVPAYRSQAESTRTFYLEVRLSEDKTKLVPPKKIDIVKIRREFAARLLNPPQEPEFDTRKIVKFMSGNHPQKQNAAIEAIFDTRSELYTLRERLVHDPEPDPAFAKGLKEAYAKLSGTDFAGARARIPALTKMAEKCPPLPMVGFNPYTWLKAYTQYGYYKHRDGCSYIDPNPWCVAFQDGMRFAFVTDPRVVQYGETGPEDSFRQLIFTKPMHDVTVERNWVSTKWNFPQGKSMTFSMLTPMINIDGTDTLELSGFNRAPDMLSYLSPRMTPVNMSLRDMTKKNETIASVLIDNTKVRKERAKAGSSFEFKEKPGRPWLLLRSQTGGWCMVINMGEKPVSAKFENGVFTLRLAKKSFFGVTKLPSPLHFREGGSLGEFFAKTALDYPLNVYETVKGDTVTWKYTYSKRTDAWGTKAEHIAPLAPLMILGDLRIPGMKKSVYPMKYGMYSFVKGDSLSFKVPDKLKPVQKLYGINTQYRSLKLLKQHAENGAHWQRLYIGGHRNPEEAYQNYEKTLQFCRENKIRVLVDPHNLVYVVSWSAGFPVDEKKSQTFVELWNRLSKIGAKYPEVIAGYDLYNELGVKEGSEYRWIELANRCIAVIRRNHPEATVFVTGVDGANPSGYFNYITPEDKNIVISFHFYTPHSFTHMKVSSPTTPGPNTFYPGWSPVFDWKTGLYYGGKSVDWFDRWQLAVIMLPVWETGIRTGLPLHCGEFGVVGYSNPNSARSAFFWTRDLCEVLHHAGVCWNLWNTGFGLCNKDVRSYMYDLWKKTKPENEKKGFFDFLKK